MKKPVYYVLLTITLLVFCFSAYLVVNYFVEGSRQADRFDELSQMVSQATEASTQPTQPSTEAATEDPAETTGSTVPAGPTEPTMIPGYAAAYDLNQDTVGWIRIDGTRINYPVMHTPGRVDYYLKRNFDQEYSEWGTIYIREDCDIWTPSDNITIYGHCMRDGSMFADLHEYLDEEFWQDHQLIYFDTLYDYHVYEIFAVFKTVALKNEGFKYHLFINAENEEEFNNYVKTCKDLAFYDTGIVPEYGDKLIALSTCEYTAPEEGRLVVAARRIF